MCLLRTVNDCAVAAVSVGAAAGARVEVLFMVLLLRGFAFIAHHLEPWPPQTLCLLLCCACCAVPVALCLLCAGWRAFHRRAQGQEGPLMP